MADGELACRPGSVTPRALTRDFSLGRSSDLRKRYISLRDSSGLWTMPAAPLARMLYLRPVWRL